MNKVYILLGIQNKELTELNEKTQKSFWENYLLWQIWQFLLFTTVRYAKWILSKSDIFVEGEYFFLKNQVKKTETNLEKFVIRSTESVVIPENVKLDIQVDLKDPHIMIDQDQMMQVLTNLEKNAIEAMPDGGLLSIRIDDNDSNFKIYIQDEGIGIPKENMEKLFTPFFTTKKLGKGTGLGLPLVYGIVKMHKGQINVISNTDKNKGKTGTTFIIDVPKF